MDYGADWRILKYQSQFSGSPGMALVLQEVYSPVVEESMRIVYHTLSEKDRRRYVAVEALKLGWKTATRTGLSTTVQVMKKVYETGRKATDEFRENLPLKFDSVLPKWNYTAIPQPGH
jgi:hypothetical protein